MEPMFGYPAVPFFAISASQLSRLRDLFVLVSHLILAHLMTS